ncbi:rho GTPase activating protein 23 [Elysia marginata]|uniref:Rho GTPase activating protein 23 n=1 Tax=Elysia marginata TaxID=1093978 RepID=A0AAV4HXI9_9GAST|nr:rho GTPase activating protein 23 [Elysia marginata]
MDSKDPRAVAADFNVPSNTFYPCPAASVNSNAFQGSVWDASSLHLDSSRPLSVGSSQPWEGPHPVVINRGPSGFGFTLRQFVVHPPQSVRDDNSDEAEGTEVSAVA